MTDKIQNPALLAAGLELMSQAGKSLERLPTKGRAMIYRMANGQTVRARTCNDHILVVVADKVTLDAKLNIEGTDFLLIVMPEIERTPGTAIAYLVPTGVAVKAVRETHAEWLKSAKTKGDNRTWNIWFGPHPKAGGFSKHWAKYFLGRADLGLRQQRTRSPGDVLSMGQQSETLGDVLNAAKRKIAEKAGVPIEAVKISIDLG